MSMPKGSVQSGAALSNSYRLEIPGLGSILFTRIGSLADELTTITLADGTAQTGGKVNPIETEVAHYIHHRAELLAFEAWYAAAKVGGPLYKRGGTLHYLGADGQPVASYALEGVFPKGRELPELDGTGDGEAVTVNWTISIDNVIPL